MATNKAKTAKVRILRATRSTTQGRLTPFVLDKDGEPTNKRTVATLPYSEALDIVGAKRGEFISGGPRGHNVGDEGNGGREVKGPSPKRDEAA